jgi:hypothetical protein
MHFAGDLSSEAAWDQNGVVLIPFLFPLGT